MSRRTPESTPLAAAGLILLALASPAAIAQLDLGQGLGQGLGKGLGKGLGGFDQAPVESVFGDSRDVLEARLVPARDSVAPGGDLPVAVILEIAPGWHLWTQPGAELEGAIAFDGAIETELEVVSLPEGLAAHPGFIQWPEPHLITADLGDGPASYAVFEGDSVAYLPVTADADAPAGEGEMVFRLRFQACDDSTCMAPATLELRMPIAVGESTGDAADVGETFASFDPAVFGRIRSGEAAPDVVDFDAFGLSLSVDIRGAGFLLLLLLAAVGGLLLNFTPCVLPVIPLKIMALSQAAGHRGRCFLLGLSMSLGVVAFWVGLGVAVASISGFTATNQLFQSPVFTIGVGVVIAALAIGMMGVFTIRLPQALYMIEPRHDTLVGSFGFGIMTAVLSTPCTAPFMGSAVVWAVTGSIATVLLVFGAVGFGMALPYLVLAAFPGLVRNMPRSGPASDLIKQVMGLLLLAAAAYFAGAGLSGLMVEPPEPPSKAYWWVVGLAGAAAGGLMLVRTLAIAKSAAPKAIFGGLGAVIVAVSGFIALRMTDEGPIDWSYYTPDRLAEAQSAGDVVVLDFTAEWCLNCKALESSVLALPSVADRLNGDGVVAMKVDLTGNNEAGNELLRASGRLTIPLLVVLASDGREIFKSDAYTPQQVIDAIAEAKGAGGGDA
ncbi:MAG: protein-disulfide reductase DsbD family protein [Planctomycetota bacterium]|jgi:thiol:disulfide interchange protein DsbD